jgi:uncharacterized protein
MTTLNLRTLKLRSGERYQDEREVQLEPVVLGGERYVPVPGLVPADLAVTRATTGLVFELRFGVRLHGPCYRCTADAFVDESIAAREYHATSAGESDDLSTPYVRDDVLDLSAWARDTMVLALPEQILCRPDCAGLCAVCGRDLNAEPHEHEPEGADPRWAALAELRDRL